MKVWILMANDEKPVDAVICVFGHEPTLRDFKELIDIDETDAEMILAGEHDTFFLEDREVR